MIKVLFVCHGNICRSTAAQMILQQIVEEAGLQDRFVIDSAATSREEIGNSVYPPMKRALEGMGVPILRHQARQVKASEYGDWDYIVGMDDENMWNLNRIFRGDPEGKCSMLMSWCGEEGREVDDPWYTGRHAETAGQIARGCRAMFDQLSAGREKTS